MTLRFPGAAATRRRRLCAWSLGLLLAAVAVTGAPAQADTAPLDPGDPRTPVTVSADALPTAQIDGVAWTQVLVGDTVFVGGEFGTARPAGAPPGTATVVRRNILAYDLRTGELKARFRPALNGQVFALAASPDGKVVYAGGEFTRVGTTPARRVVALRAGNGAPLTSFKVRADAPVRALVARGKKVWLGGSFNVVNGVSRAKLAAVRAGNGSLTRWAPAAANGPVRALALAPNGRSMVVGGQFTRLNGSGRPGYGLGRVDTGRGGSLPMPVNDVVRNAGDKAGIWSLSGDSAGVYGTGFAIGRNGNFEGTFAATWAGRLRWFEDCHGDTYGAFPGRTAVYVVGHPHSCETLGGFPETEPRTYHRAVAFSRQATGVLAPNTTPPYASFAGLPAPSLLVWFPSFGVGSYTGKEQGPWTVTGDDRYVVVAGEFPTVNGVAQQGLARFAVSALAPNQQGPQATAAALTPRLRSSGRDEVSIRWDSTWDRDNEHLTYEVVRHGVPEPVASVSAATTFWRTPELSHTEGGLPPGTHTYRIRVTDAFGNSRTSLPASITLAP
jgi:hypothetical protein